MQTSSCYTTTSLPHMRIPHPRTGIYWGSLVQRPNPDEAWGEILLAFSRFMSLLLLPLVLHTRPSPLPVLPFSPVYRRGDIWGMAVSPCRRSEKAMIIDDFWPLVTVIPGCRARMTITTTAINTAFNYHPFEWPRFRWVDGLGTVGNQFQVGLVQFGSSSTLPQT